MVVRPERRPSRPCRCSKIARKSDVGNKREVVVFALDKDPVKYFDSGTASCPANLARLPEEEKCGIDVELVAFNKQRPIER